MSSDLSQDYSRLSKEEGKECFGRYCACLSCRHEDYFCIDGDPCSVCDGRLKDITTTFCTPTDEELAIKSS